VFSVYLLWETGLLSLLKFDLKRLGYSRPMVSDSDPLTGKRTESELQAAFPYLQHA
jgi:hypothetical protein